MTMPAATPTPRQWASPTASMWPVRLPVTTAMTSRAWLPNAQLMIMKIFEDNSGSTSDDIILAGVDDAVKLGADSINMSLGSPAGFTEYGDENEEETDSYLTYYGVYTRAQEAGVNVMVAAGNETSSTYYNPAGTQLTLAQYPDSAIVASPSTLEASVSVASVDNVGYFRNHFALGETKIPYNGGVDYNSQVETNILDTMEGQTLEYVPVPGLGEKRTLKVWTSPARLPWWLVAPSTLT